MKKILLQVAFVFSALFSSFLVQAQSVGINGTGSAPNGSAMLDVSSTTKGMLIPRMIENQRNAIALPATGLLIYQTDDTTGFYYFDGTIWRLIGSGIGWALAGNGGTTPGTNFIGTTDANDFVFKTNDNENMRIANGSGNLVLGSGDGTGAATGNTLRAPNGSGTNIAGANLMITSGNGTGTGGSGNLIFQTASTGSAGSTANTMAERLRITPSGYVGIGTTNPASLLSVGSSSQFQVNSSGDIVSIKGVTYSWPSSNPGSGNIRVMQNDGSGNLTWATVNSTLITSNVTSGTTGVTIGNGTGQVVGASNLTVDVATNSSSSPGLVPAGSGNNNKAWLTDGSGNPSWKDVDLNSDVTNVLPIANGGTDLSTTPLNGQLLIGNGAGYTLSTINTSGAGISVTNAAGSITLANTGVTSVGLALPNIFTVTNSPVTTTGTLTGTLANQTANTIFAGPISGGAATPTFRTLVPADIPASSVTANSGVNVNAGNNVQLGGTLMQTTTITQANYDLISNMTGTGNFRVQSSGTDALVVNSATGEVGIGKSIPAQALDVVGNITFSQALMPNGLAGTAGNILLSAGASTAPTWLPAGLDGQVLGTNAGVPTWGTISLSGTVITANNGINFNTASNVQLGGSLVQATTITQGNYDLISNMSGTGNFRVQDAGTDVFGVYSATGNVAIGTTNPLSLLHVNGTETLGTPSGGTVPTTGTLVFNNNSSTNSVSISAGNTTTGYSLTLPTAQGAANTVLTNNGAGVLTWSPSASFANLTPGTGLTGAVYNGSTARTFAVSYGSTAGSAVQGNTTLTVTPGTGMSGGGTITLGAGGTVTLNNTGVTSVGLVLPNIFTVTNSPVTTTGTLTGALANENANMVFAGPVSGGAAVPTFRALIAADVPAGAVTANNGLIVNSGNNVQLGGALIQATTITQGNYDLISNMTGTGNFRVQSNGTDALVVNSATGEVGIGKSIPAQALDVAGNITFSQALMPNGLAGTAGNILLSAGASTAPTWLPAGFDGQVLSTNAGVPTWGTISASVITANNGISFSSATNLQLGGSLVQATTITQGNYDLISNMSGTGNFRVQDAGTDVFGVYSATGDVAIGTTNPLSLLHVNGTETLGTPNGGTTPATGTLVFNNSSSTNSVSISAGNTATGYSLTLPTVQGAANTVLTNDGSGTLTWALPSASLLNLTPGTGLTGSAYNGSAAETFAVNYGSIAGTAVQGNITLTVTPGTGMSGGGTITLGTGGTVTLNNTGVTSVGLALPSIFAVTNSPVTTTGTLTGTLANETANMVFAGPTSGGAATPTFRALVAADVPAGSVTANNGLTINTGNNVQLGGTLIGNTSIISGGNNLAFTGTGALQLGVGSASTGTLQFLNSTNNNAIGISAGATTTAYNLTLPLAQGAANTVLTNNGSGTLTWAAASAALSNLTPGTGLTGSAYNGSTAQTFAVNYGSTAGSAVQGNTTLTITAGTGMSGGGTITLGSGGTVTLNNTGVTSVALALPSIFTVSGSPVTTTGTLTGTFTTETANTVFAGPSSGGAATPTFRALVAADVPAGTVTANNGLTVNTGNNVQLGGTLIQSTTITHATYDLIHNLNSTGNFRVQNSGSDALSVRNSTGNVVIGSGEGTATVAGNILRAPNATGANIAGANFILTSGDGTGTGGSGSIIFQTAPVGAAGAVANTMTERMRLTATGALAFSGAANYGTSGSMLQSSGNATPAWSTATYPSTTTADQILYSSSNNTVTGLAAGANGLVLTMVGGVPTWAAASANLSNLTPGTGLTGSAYNGSAAQTFAVNYGSTAGSAVQGNTTLTVTAGTGMSGGGTITLGAGGTVTLNNTGVTSVGLALPSIFTVSGSPVTTTGTLTGTFTTETANTVFAGPASGGATTPTFRTLVAADIPAGTVTANNGVTISAGNNVQLGGTLIANTTIVSGGNNLAFTGTGIFQLGAASSSTGTLQFLNSTTNKAIGISAGATTTAYNLTLPLVQGAANTVLTNNGAGVLSWTTPSTSNTAWQLTGNSNTTAGTNFVGTTDANDLVFETNSTENMRISNSTGNVVIGNGEGGSAVGNTIRAPYNNAGGNKTGADITIASGAPTGKGASGNIIFQTLAANVGSPGNSSDLSIMAEAMRLSAAGYLGIGTANPLSLLHVNGTETLGTSSGGTTPATGTLTFNNSSSVNSVNISAGNTSTGYSLTLPLAQGAANTVLTNNGSGTLTWAAASAALSNLTPGTGLTGSAYNGSTAQTFAVNYGSTAGSAVQGNTTLTITAGTGMSGGGTITLGSGGTVTLNNTGVTSVALALPSIFTVSGSPVTTTGTLTGTFTTETANTVFAGPSSGGAATPTFRALVAADVPAGTVTANNGLTVNTGNNVQLGGTLIQSTTITHATYDLIHNLNSTGNFRVQNSGSDALSVRNSTGNVVIGSGEGTATVAGNILRAPNATGTNIAGVDFTIAGGNGTGTGGGGDVVIQTSPIGATGATANTLTERVRINYAGNVIVGSGEATATVAGNTLRAPNATGTNIAGANLTITSGDGTGTGGSGNIIFQTAPVGATGAVANTMTERMRLTTTGALAFSGAANYGSSGSMLQSTGNATPAWSTATYPTTTTANQILYSSAANTVTGLTAGSNGQVLTMVAGVPTWTAAASSGWALTGNSGTTAGTNFVGTTDATDFEVKTGVGPTERMHFVNSTGNVVIGSGEGTAAVTGNTLRAPNAVGTNIAGVDFTIAGGDGTGLGGGGDVVFQTAPIGATGTTANALTERMRIAYTGNVIIGTGDGTGTVTGNILRGPNPVGTNIAGVDFTIAGGGGTGNGGGGDVVFQTAPAAASGATANTLTERMRIMYTGNVGIGTAAPSTLLQVNGTESLGTPSTTTGTLQFDNSSNVNTVSISAGTTSTSYSMTLPTAQGAANTVLTNNGSGTLSWGTSPASPLKGIICDTTAGTSTVSLAAGTTWIMVKCIGGGGAGGGIGKTTCTHGTDEAGSGGGAGAYCEGYVTGISVGTTTVSVTVGGGGVGAAGCNAISAASGGNTTVTVTSPAASFTAGGGGGGSTFEVNTTATNLAGGQGGTASGGSINIPGANGGNAICSVTGTDVVFAGEGASTMFGNGGQQQYTRDQEEYTGLSARAPGAGGGGAVAVQQTGNIATNGGNGSHGIVIIYEY